MIDGALRNIAEAFNALQKQIQIERREREKEQFSRVLFEKHVIKRLERIEDEMKKKPKAAGKVKKVMHEFKENKLHSGSKKGPVVKSKAQAVAIGLSEARKAGGKVPAKKKK